MSLMLSCKEIVRLVSDELETKMPIITRLKMMMHLSMCENCQNYRDQIQHVETMIRKHYSEDNESTSSSSKLSDNAVKRIEKSLQKAMKS